MSASIPVHNFDEKVGLFISEVPLKLLQEWIILRPLKMIASAADCLAGYVLNV